MKILRLGFCLVLLLTSFKSFSEMDNPYRCEGVKVIFRISDIVPDGSIEGIKKATQMHESWYRTNGVKQNRLVLGEIYKADSNTNTIFADNTKVISLHIDTPNPEEGTVAKNWGDAGYKEFISEYNKNSKITNEIRACLPKGIFIQN